MISLSIKIIGILSLNVTVVDKLIIRYNIAQISITSLMLKK